MTGPTTERTDRTDRALGGALAPDHAAHRGKEPMQTTDKETMAWR